MPVTSSKLPPEISCRFCKEEGKVTEETCEAYDGGHEDYHYTCAACNKSWWVDGIDS